MFFLAPNQNINKLKVIEEYLVKQKMSASEQNHVHFDESTDVNHGNEIVVKTKGENKLEIQLGFLQVNHVYEVMLVLSRNNFSNCQEPR